MSWLSPKDANTLRAWLTITAAVHSAEDIGVAIPGRPLGLMILVFLSLQADEVATYTALRTEYRLNKAALSDALRALKDSGLVASVGVGKDGRERQLQLTGPGREVIGRILRPRPATTK